MNTPILALDFDGVLHSYTSGWRGPRNIPDAPVPGALEFLVAAMNEFQVAIHSSRSRYFGGRRAMKQWLHQQLILQVPSFDDCPSWWAKRIATTAFSDPWPHEVDYAARLVVKEISWPLFKPPAMVTIDDRAITFTGEWPSIDALLAFKPWNKKGQS